MDTLVKYSFAFETLETYPNAVRADRTVYKGAFTTSLHKHDFVQILYCHKGHYFHQVDGRVYECGPGSVVVLPVSTVHQFWSDEEADLIRLSVRMHLLDLAAPADYINSTVNMFLPDFFDELKLNFSCHTALSPESRVIWERILSWVATLNYAHGEPLQAEIMRQKMEEIFSVPEFAVSEDVLEKAQRLVQTRISPIFKIVSYLNQHYPEKITDEILQQEGNVSRAVMYRYFKRIMKDTYANFLQNLRARRAHVYMRETIYTLSDIAEMCGFYDVYHMSRVYAKCSGMTISKQRVRMEQCRRERSANE